MKIKKICQQCGREFKARGDYPQQVTCSQECRAKYFFESKRLKLKCAICDKSFMVYPAKAKRKGRFAPKYCSVSCQAKARENKIKRKCQTCGRVYLVIKSREKRSKYCSCECFAKGKAKWIKKRCLFCGKTFDVKSNRKNNKFCGRKCFQKYQIGKKRSTFPGMRGGLVKRKCLNCGVEFESERYRKQQYCSQACGVGAIETTVKALKTRYFKELSNEAIKKFIQAKKLAIKIRRSLND